jgi:tripartite-type tricarboxylate transporter receptor subunit TctC
MSLRTTLSRCARACGLALSSLLLLAAAPAALAQAYPAKPVKLIVPYGAGFAPDVFARLVAERLQARMGQPFVVENYQGAGGKIGLEAFARAPADGYTLFLGSKDTQSILQHLYQLPMDPARDIAPVSIIARLNNLIVVGNDVPVKNFREFVDLAKAQPGKITYASPGIGTNLHLIGEMLKQRLGINIEHVPYRALGNLIADVTTGKVTSAITGIPPLLQHVKTGKVRALVTMGATRSPHLPDVPTLAESGYPDFAFSTWFGIIAPKGTPQAVIDKLQQEIAAVVQDPGYRERINGAGAEAAGSTARELSDIIIKDAQLWGEVVRTAKIKVE